MGAAFSVADATETFKFLMGRDLEYQDPCEPGS